MTCIFFGMIDERLVAFNANNMTGIFCKWQREIA